MDVKLGDIYTYALRNPVLFLRDEIKRPFVVISVSRDDVVMIPIGVRYNHYFDHRRVYCAVKIGDKDRNVCFFSDISICVPMMSLNEKVGSIKPGLLSIIREKSKHNFVFYDDYERDNIVDETDIVIDDESVFDHFINDIDQWNEGNDNEGETRDKIIFDSNSVILDKPDSELLIPIVYHSERIITIKLLFKNMDGEKTQVKRGTDDYGDKRVVVLECMNFNSVLGTSSVTPIAIGTINNKEISIQISSGVKDKERPVREVCYTVYWEK